MCGGALDSCEGSGASDRTAAPALGQKDASAGSFWTGISVVGQSGLGMTFTLSATVSAGVINTATRTLTLTLVDAP